MTDPDYQEWLAYAVERVADHSFIGPSIESLEARETSLTVCAACSFPRYLHPYRTYRETYSSTHDSVGYQIVSTPIDRVLELMRNLELAARAHPSTISVNAQSWGDLRDRLEPSGLDSPTLFGVKCFLDPTTPPGKMVFKNHQGAILAVVDI